MLRWERPWATGCCKGLVCHSCKKTRTFREDVSCKTDPGEQAERLTTADDAGRETSSSPMGKEDETAYALHTVQSKGRPIMVGVHVQDVPLDMELDTGASKSVISEKTYRSTWPLDPPTLEPSTVSLKTYSGEKLQVQGCLNVCVEYKGQTTELPLLIVGGMGPSLQGRDWLYKLRLDWPEICHVQHTSTLQEILDKACWEKNWGS